MLRISLAVLGSSSFVHKMFQRLRIDALMTFRYASLLEV